MDKPWIIHRPQALRGLGMEFQVIGVVRDTTLTANNLHQCSKLRFYFVRHPGALVHKTCTRQLVHALPLYIAIIIP